MTLDHNEVLDTYRLTYRTPLLREGSEPVPVVTDREHEELATDHPDYAEILAILEDAYDGGEPDCGPFGGVDDHKSAAQMKGETR